MGIPSLSKIPYVGVLTCQALAEAFATMTDPVGPLPPMAPIIEGPVEECAEPLVLVSRFSAFRFPMRRTLRYVNPSTGETQVDAPLFVEFEEKAKGEGGQAKITSIMWFLRVHQGDRVKADADVEAGKPWRRDCYAWLRTRNSFRNHSWTILPD